MADELKKESTKVELDLDELEQVAGGAYVDGDPLNYHCGFCAQVFLFHSKAEAKAHVRSCPKNPNNT